ADLRVRPGGGAQALSRSAEGTAGEHAGDPADGQAPLFAAPAVPVPEPSPPAAAPSDPGRAAATRASGLRTTAGFEAVDELPVASVRLVGVLPHLDRPLEYAVTPAPAAAGPRLRVRVRFSGKDTEGIVLARHAEPTTDRPLAPLHRLVSDDVVVPPALMRACEDVAERCAGTVGDVLRLALPPRHARAEKSDRAAEAKDAERTAEAPSAPAVDPSPPAQDAAPPAPRPGDRYPGLAALLSRAGSATGPVPRATLTLDAADTWTTVAADAISDLDPAL